MEDGKSLLAGAAASARLMGFFPLGILVSMARPEKGVLRGPASGTVDNRGSAIAVVEGN